MFGWNFCPPATSATTGLHPSTMQPTRSDLSSIPSIRTNTQSRAIAGSADPGLLTVSDARAIFSFVSSDEAGFREFRDNHAASELDPRNGQCPCSVLSWFYRPRRGHREDALASSALGYIRRPRGRVDARV
jgi:hypothetical protein